MGGVCPVSSCPRGQPGRELPQASLWEGLRGKSGGPDAGAVLRPAPCWEAAGPGRPQPTLPGTSQRPSLPAARSRAGSGAQAPSKRRTEGTGATPGLEGDARPGP